MIPHSRPWIVDSDRQAVEAVMRTGMVARGGLVDRFEELVATYVGSNHAIAQSSGTASLILALKTLQIGVGDNVVLPTYVCRSVLEATLSVGATPQFCDVNDCGVIEPTALTSLVDDSTKAIIAVHIFGHPCPILALRDYDLPIIEDACQSFGLRLGDARAGSLGDIGIFSFHATKCLTTGEGGMLVTNNPDYAARAIQIAKGSEMPGERIPCAMSDIQAALGLSQLSRYDDIERRRNELFALYNDAAQQKGLGVGTPCDCNLPFRFTLRVEAPFQKVQERCEELGVSIRKGVDELLHRTMHLDDARFLNSVHLFNTTISVPFYPSISETESERVVAVFDIIAKYQ
jgi:perosamine synthetase